MIIDNNNPYVGLRPFEMDESILFFGRNEQTLELLQRLHQHHFVAVVGSSGCGKSSLLRAGLIPSLKAGYLIDDSDHWFIAIMKPGKNPLYNFAEAILHQVNTNTSGNDVAAFVQKINEGGADVILDLIAPIEKEKNINFFLLVDQFEELFRFAMDQKDAKRKDEAIDFVNIILELSQQKNIPFFTVITMRSDFIGDCTQFHGLPEALNKSQYLVPRLNRMELKMAIEGPARLYGGKFNPALTSRLLNELGKVKDELPLLQHALMRMWDFENDADKSGDIDLHDYDKIGGIEMALNNHADEALAGLNNNEQLVAKKMFQALTAIDENGRKIRRPALLSQLKELTGASESQLLKIIEQFIKDRRSFLMINRDGSTGERIIDISHESLIRQWNTLNQWVDEEGESASNYLRLVEAARLHKQNRKDLLTGSEFHLATEWYDKYNPSAAWANRYKPGFDDAVEYLKNSEMEKVRMMNYETARRRKQRRLVAAVIALLAISAIGGGFFSFRIKNQNDRIKLQSSEINRQNESLRNAVLAARIERDKADSSAKVAIRASEKADSSALAAEIAKENALAAQTATSNALRALQKSRRNEQIAQQGRMLALQGLKASDAAFKLHIRAQDSLDAGNTTYALRLEEKAIELYDIPYFRETAEKIYRENNFYSHSISPRAKIIHASLLPGTDSLLLLLQSLQGDYRIIKWSLDGNPSGFIGNENSLLSADGNGVYTQTDNSLELRDIKGNLIKDLGVEPADKVTLTNDKKKILTVHDKIATLWDNDKNNKYQYKTDTAINALAISPDGQTIAIGTNDFKVIVLKVEGSSLKTQRVFQSGSDINVLSFSPNGKNLLFNFSYFNPAVWDISDLKDSTQKPVILIGHYGEVISAAFSPDGKTIATGANDGTARLWDMKGKTLETYYHYEIINNISFSADGKKLLTSSLSDRTIRLWDIDVFPLNVDAPSLYYDSVFYNSEKKTINWFDTVSEKKQAVNFDNPVTTARLAFITPNRNRDLLFIIVNDTGYYRWNLKDNSLLKLINFTEEEVSSNRLSYDGKYFALGYWDGRTMIWDLSDDGSPITLGGHVTLVKGIGFSYDNKFIVTGSGDGLANLWEINSQKLIGSFEHPTEVASVEFSPDGRTIITSCYDYKIRRWNIDTEDLLNELDGEITAIAWGLHYSTDGKYILATYPSYNLSKLFDIDGTQLMSMPGSFFFTQNEEGETVLTTKETTHYWKLRVLSLEDFLRSNKIEALKPEEEEEEEE